MAKAVGSLSAHQRIRRTVGISIMVVPRFISEKEFIDLDPEMGRSVLRATRFAPPSEAVEARGMLLSEPHIVSLEEKTIELWCGHGEVTDLAAEGLQIRASPGELLVRAKLRESTGLSLQEATYRAYRSVFKLISENPEYRLARLWNYIPRILSGAGESERYRIFNQGRWDAWQDFGPILVNGDPDRPAATGIGSVDGDLIIEALLVVHPVVNIENPRQTQFIHYSRRWGRRPPVSARASVVFYPDGPSVLVAGTASLVGEEVAHLDDPAAQAWETLRNLEVLLSEENMARHGVQAGFSLQQLHGVRIYIKQPEHRETIEQVVRSEWASERTLFVQDHICRPGFLLEIEGVARA